MCVEGGQGGERVGCWKVRSVGAVNGSCLGAHFLSTCASALEGGQHPQLEGIAGFPEVLFVLGWERLDHICWQRERNWKVGDFEALRDKII